MIGTAARPQTAVFPPILTHPGLLAGSTALLVYLLTLAPDLTWRSHGGDGGELIAASVTLGVPHPTGYPTYVLLGKLFSLLPLGTVAYRFNLFSAVAVAAAVGLTAVTLHTRFSRSTSLAASLTLAFAPLVWSQATITEVYGLNLLAVAAVVWAVVGKRPLFLTTLLFALALTTHATSLLLLPLVSWAIWERLTAEGAEGAKKEKEQRFGCHFEVLREIPLTLPINRHFSLENRTRTNADERGQMAKEWEIMVVGRPSSVVRRPSSVIFMYRGEQSPTIFSSKTRRNDIFPPIAPSGMTNLNRYKDKTPRSLRPLRFNFLFSFLLGLTPLLALPWLARPASPIVWGQPDTLRGWWWLVSGQLYRPNLFALPWPDLAQRLAEWGPMLAGQFSWLGLPLIVWGMWTTDDGRRMTVVSRRWSVVGLTAVLLLLHPLTYATPDAHVLLLPALLLLTFPLAAGMEGVSRKGAKTQSTTRHSRVGGNPLFATLPLCLPLFLLATHITQPPAEPAPLRPAVAQIFAHAPANAVLLTPGDATIFTLWYFHHAEQQRPDLVLVDSNLFAFDWYRQRLADQYPHLRQLTHDNLTAFQQANHPFCTATLNPATLVCSNGTRMKDEGRKTEDETHKPSSVVRHPSSVVRHPPITYDHSPLPPL